MDLHINGDVAHGAGSLGAFLNNVQFDTGGGAMWMDRRTLLDQRIVYQHWGEDGEYLGIFDRLTGEIGRAVTEPQHLFYNRGASAIASGGGRWAAWANGFGLFTSWDLYLPHAGLIGMGDAGELIYAADQQKGLPVIVREANGVEWILSEEPAYDIRIYGDRRATWNDKFQKIHSLNLPELTTVSGALYRPRAAEIEGQWWISYFCEGRGIFVHPFHETIGYVLVPSGSAWQEISSLNKTRILRGAWSTRAGEIAGDVLTHDYDTTSDPRVELNTIFVPPVNKKLWLGFFTGRPGTQNGGWDTSDDPPGTATTPGNAILDVPTSAVMNTATNKPVGLFITGDTVEQIEAKCQAWYEPSVAYWDGRNWPRYPNLPDRAWLAVQAYCGVTESVTAFEADIQRILTDIARQQPKRKIAIVAQCYTSNPSLTRNLAELVPVFSRLARHANVTMVLPFSGNGRKTGLQDNPEARAPWEQFAASITGTPEDAVSTQPPKFTISEPTFPVSGNEPLSVRCIYKEEAHSGSLEWIEWLYSTIGGGGPWKVAARNPGDDHDHTYKFTDVGTYWIKARGGNAAGTHETGAERKVTVVASGPPDPPDPPKPPTGKKTSIRSVQWGNFWGVRGDGVIVQSTETEFEVVKVPGGVALKAPNGRFVCAENGGSQNQLIANRDSVGAWETFQEVRVSGGIAFKAVNGKFVSAQPDGSITVDRDSPGPWETFQVSGNGNGAVTEGRLSIDGRMIRDGSGVYYRAIWSSCLAVLLKDHEAVLDHLLSTGFNGARIFCGNLPWAGQTPESCFDPLPRFIEAAQDRGMRVEVCALTGTGENPYDPREYVRRIIEIINPYENAILEFANEPWHPTQKNLTPEFLASLLPMVPPEVIVGLGAAQNDEDDQYTKFGGWGSVHLDRGRDEWNMVRRVRELEAMSDRLKKPIWNNEPIKQASQNGNPSIAFTMGVLNRGFEVQGIHHSDSGLQGTVPGEGTADRACQEAFVRGSRLVTTNARMTFKNTGWHDSPIKSFTGAVRCYSFMSDQNITCALGIDGNLNIEMQNGWQLGQVIDEMPGVKVYELVR